MGKGNGRKEEESILILMKEITNVIKRKAMEFLYGLQEMFIKVNIIRMKERVMVKCFGLMVAFILEAGLEEFKMDGVR